MEFINGRFSQCGFMSAACIYKYYIYPLLRRTLKALDHVKNAAKYGRSIKEEAHPRIVPILQHGGWYSRNCTQTEHEYASWVEYTTNMRAWNGDISYRWSVCELRSSDPCIAAERSFVFVVPFGGAPGANAECVM